MNHLDAEHGSNITVAEWLAHRIIECGYRDEKHLAELLELELGIIDSATKLQDVIDRKWKFKSITVPKVGQ